MMGTMLLLMVHSLSRISGSGAPILFSWVSNIISGIDNIHVHVHIPINVHKGEENPLKNEERDFFSVSHHLTLIKANLEKSTYVWQTVDELC